MGGSIGTSIGDPDLPNGVYRDPYRSPAEMPTIEIPKKRSIMRGPQIVSLCVISVYVAMGGFFVGECRGEKHGREIQKAGVVPACPANDSIVYVDKRTPEDQAKPFSCPVNGQELTVVRDLAWATYIRCSCPKTP